MEEKKFEEQSELKDYIVSVVARGKLGPIIDFIFYDDLSGPKQSIFIKKKGRINSSWVGSAKGMLDLLDQIFKENKLDNISEIAFVYSYNGGEYYLLGDDLNESKLKLGILSSGDLHASIVVILLDENEGVVKVYGQIGTNVSPNYYVLNYEDIKQGIIIREAIKSSLVDLRELVTDILRK